MFSFPPAHTLQSTTMPYGNTQRLMQQDTNIPLLPPSATQHTLLEQILYHFEANCRILHCRCSTRKSMATPVAHNGLGVGVKFPKTLNHFLGNLFIQLLRPSSVLFCWFVLPHRRLHTAERVPLVTGKETTGPTENNERPRTERCTTVRAMLHHPYPREN